MRRMKKNRRMIRISVVSIIIFLMVMTVGYAAFSTNLHLNAKGNIKSSTGADLIRKTCNATSGDGLYKDSTEEGRCVFRGENPNNHLKFNDQYIRIISVESDNTLKVVVTQAGLYMRYDYFNLMDFLTGDELDPVEGTRYTFSNSDYCLAIEAQGVWGCNVWGSKDTMLDSNGNHVTTMAREVGGTKYNLPSTEAAINIYLNTTYYNNLNNDKDYIDEHLFDAGVISTTEQTLETDVLQEKTNKWKGKIGLLSATDFVKSSLDETCTNVWQASLETYRCQNSYLANAISLTAMTMTPYSSNVPKSAFCFSTNYSLNYFYTYTNMLEALPVFYLKSDTNLTGTGTSIDPYIIS